MSSLPAALHRAALVSPLTQLSGPSCIKVQRRFGSASKRRVKKEKVADTSEDDLVKWKAARREAGQVNIGIFKPLPAKQFSHELLERKDPPTFPSFPTALRTHPPGTVMEFSAEKSKAIPVFGVPRNMLLDFRLMSKPCSLVTESATKLMALIESSKDQSSSKQRHVITGPKGCGKSFHLLQAVEYCEANNWIVLYIPRAVKLMDSTTNHQYDARTQTYVQPKFTLQILQRFANVNEIALKELKLQVPITLDNAGTIPEGDTLHSAILRAVKEPYLGTIVLNAVMDELGKQTTYPVLLAVDDFQALYHDSHYRDPRYQIIKSYHLALPRMLLEFGSGQRNFRRGMFLGAVSSSRTEFLLPLELREALGLPYERATSAYEKRTPEYIGYTTGLQAFPVPEKLSLAEAAALLETWTSVQGGHTPLEDGAFLTKYSEASGNAREFVWQSMFKTLDS